MPNTYRTTEEIFASRLDDGKLTRLQLSNMGLFASGAFSNVYKGVARSDSTAAEVVIKKTWPRSKGAPLEVKILGRLNRLKHKNIVRLLYSYQKEHDGRICLALIFEYVPLNLHQFLKQNQRQLDIVEVKLITWQLFRGQSHLNKNLLYNADSGLLKISDFGSSSLEVSKSSVQPSYHVTRYYRPPELLLGSQKYGCEIDIWSCGCVLGELLKGGVFLAGRNTANQIELIFDLLGKPSSEELTAMKANKEKYEDTCQSYLQGSQRKIDFSFLYNPNASTQRDRRTAVLNMALRRQEMMDSVNVLRQVLVYDPQNRLGGVDLLMHPYFHQLFEETTVRSNGKRITCLSASDYQNAKAGDQTVTIESTDV
ncbi:unnamed protein product [Caenorhabditis sp. 36 PRJEB53466]|nr:unnamed protein product [Caenorhabditis sp. 36 PRJEB53466]